MPATSEIAVSTDADSAPLDLDLTVPAICINATESPPVSPSKKRTRPLVGVVCIVDLAPAESVRLMGQRRGTKVNQSLLALNKVIHELAAGGPHVSYRGSKLTRLLEPCLSTNCRISIVCCMTTSLWWVNDNQSIASAIDDNIVIRCADETRSALDFASTARKLRMHAVETCEKRARRSIMNRQTNSSSVRSRSHFQCFIYLCVRDCIQSFLHSHVEKIM